MHITGSGSDGQAAPGPAARRAANQSPPDTDRNGKQPPAATPRKEKKPSLLRRLWNVIK
jgi:hypothetical protein